MRTDSWRPAAVRGFVWGAAAGLALVALMYLAGSLLGLRPLPQALSGPFLAIMPGFVFGFLIDTLQHAGKVVEEIGLIVAMVIGLGVLGAVWAVASRRWAILQSALIFAAVGWLVVAAVLWLVWRRTRSPSALAWLGLHPLFGAVIVNNGQIDAFVGLAILAAVLLAAERRGVAAGLAIAAASLVKITGLLALAGIVFNVLLITRAPLQLFQAIQTSLLPHLAGLETTRGHAAFARSTTSVSLAPPADSTIPAARVSSNARSTAVGKYSGNRVICSKSALPASSYRYLQGISRGLRDNPSRSSRSASLSESRLTSAAVRGDAGPGSKLRRTRPAGDLRCIKSPPRSGTR